MNIKNVQGGASSLSRNSLLSKVVLLSVTAALVVGGLFVFNTGIALAQAIEDSASVSTLDQLNTALADTEVSTINLTANIETPTRLLLNHPATINGGGFTIKFTGTSITWVSGASNYVLQVYKTNATINDLKLTGGYAALLVNGSNVTLGGTIDVTGNNVGGIESSNSSVLTISTATILNSSEAYALPTVWEDGTTGSTVIGGTFARSLTVRAGQIQYYLLKSNSTKTATVLTLAELKAALADVNVATINITSGFSTSEKIVVDRSITINGGNNTITFTSDASGWQGNYVLQVYKTTATIDSLKLTGGDAALLVNGSDVTLTGAMDVSGNEFGGIEASKGSATGNAKLTVTGATFTNTTEAYSLPTIWTVNGQGTLIGGENFTTNTTIKSDQTQYYMDVRHLDIIAPVITLTGTNPVTITQGNVYTDAGATATDNVDTNVTVSSTGTIDTNTVGVYIITYSATDSAGNVATPVTRTINVVPVSGSGSIVPPAAVVVSSGGGSSYVAPATTPVVTTPAGQVLGASTGPTSTVIAGCDDRTTGFSVTTGQSCVGNTGTVSTVGQVLGAQSFNFTLFLKNGSKGNEVTELQKFLNTAGHDSGTADGKFGSKTKTALIKFQVANNLNGDGIVGPKVRALLNA